MPVLEPLLSEHLDDNFGELLPHPFLWHITRWIQAQDPETPHVARLLDMLEAAYHHEADVVSEMIHVSFLENLDADTWVWSRLGPVLSAAARLIYGNEPQYYPLGLRHG